MNASAVVAGAMLALAGSSLVADPAGAQSGRGLVVVAVVGDVATGAVLKDAEVWLPELRRSARTGWSGEVRLDGIPRGTHRVRVRRIGYAAVDARLRFAGDTARFTFLLEAQPTVLDTVAVTARAVPPRLRDFERRRRLGFGRFLTADDLAGDRDRDFANVVRARFPGVRVEYNEDGRPVLVSTRGPGGTGSGFANRPCPVQVYLDGMRWPDEEIDVVRTWDLSGAELHSGSNAPVQYRAPGSACGVLLLWSR